MPSFFKDSYINMHTQWNTGSVRAGSSISLMMSMKTRPVDMNNRERENREICYSESDLVFMNYISVLITGAGSQKKNQKQSHCIRTLQHIC